MAPINTHSKDKDCSALAMLADLSLEAVSDTCACGGLLDRTNTHVLLSPDAIARVIAITPASDHAIAMTPEGVAEGKTCKTHDLISLSLISRQPYVILHLNRQENH